MNSPVSQLQLEHKLYLQKLMISTNPSILEALD